MDNTKSTENYLLLFRSVDWYKGLPEEKVREIVADWMDWYARLVKNGVVESGRPLAPEGRVVSGAGAISDGPFAEAKETVGGYFVLNAATMNEAVAVARQCPGLPYGVNVEVRPLLDTCPAAKPEAASLAKAMALGNH